MSDPPFGWLQWKGTNACLDVHCACGELTHIDGEFLYYIKCGKCGAVYECDGHIQLKRTEGPEGGAAIITFYPHDNPDEDGGA